MLRMIFGAALTAALLCACQRPAFVSPKQEAMGKSVFGHPEAYNEDDGSAAGQIQQPGDAGGVITQPGGAGGSILQPAPSPAPAVGQLPQPSPAPGQLPQPIPLPGLAGGYFPQPSPVGGQVPQPVGSSPVIPLKTLCSSAQAMAAGSTAMSAAALEVVVKDASGSTVCDLTAGVKDGILKNRTLDLTACKLTGSSYSVTLTNPARPGSQLLFLAGPSSSIPISAARLAKDASGKWSVEGDTVGAVALFQLAVLWGNNPMMDSSVSAAQCDTVASPLVVNMTPPAAPDPGMLLSSPVQGVFFDILGLNARPAPHTKKRISWIGNPNYMFLALPRAGTVFGIDQLFGNNTLGPDGEFASDGFAALAKYDANHDGVIDSADPVYAELRLWSDADQDALSRGPELRSLREMRVRRIDLHYDPTFFEQDRYGNQSRLRSTVETEDGGFRVIFDLWFALP